MRVEITILRDKIPTSADSNLQVHNNDAAQLREQAEVLRLYSRYAGHKADAVEDRQMGNISAARHAEAICDTIYHQLPEELRRKINKLRQYRISR